MFPKRTGIVFVCGTVALLAEMPAVAWESHRTIMSVVLPHIAKNLSPQARKKLEANWPTPCPLEEFQTYQKLASQLQLNPLLSAEAPLPPLSVSDAAGGDNPETQCGRKFKLNALSALARSITDEPDMGMDQNLDAELDPLNERPWMGGKTGIHSQGFRHMYFGGWNAFHPFHTFQIPIHAVGQAPNRLGVLATQAQQLFSKEGPVWGTRLMGWALHYAQDLSQPFHSVQVPRLKWLPWNLLLSVHPKDAFQKFVADSTRVIANYHYAYERYVQYVFQQKPETWNQCLTTNSVSFSKVAPLELGFEIADRSRGLMGEYGGSIQDFFGTELTQPEFNIPQNKGEIDYALLFESPDKADSRDRLHAMTCEALRLFESSSRTLIEWILKPS